MAWLLSYEVIDGSIFERRKVFEERYSSRNAALRAYEKAERELWRNRDLLEQSRRKQVEEGN